MKKERVIVSETEHGPVATDAAGPDAETGEADDVSEYSEEAGGFDPAGEDAAPSSADALADDAGFGADGEEEKADDAREEFERELRKVIWPTRKELVTYTVVCMVFVIFMVIIVTSLDYGFTKLIFALFG